MKRYVWMSLAAAVAMLLWSLAIADPCLIAFLKGGADPTANPIAITSCGYDPGTGLFVLTNGDVIIRMTGLFLVAGIVALVLALSDPARVRRNVIASTLAGLAVGGSIYLAMRTVVYGFDPASTGVLAQAALVCALITTAGAAAGATLAATTWSEEP
jgi:hypothetical protein